MADTTETTPATALPATRVRQRARPAPAAKVQPVAEGTRVGPTGDDLADTLDGDLTGLDLDLAADAPPSPLDDKDSEIAQLLKASQKRFGTHTIMRASARPTFRHCTTGSFMLDLAMLGGVPMGLVTMLTGWQHCGKSATGDAITANFQKALPDMVASKVDIEGTYDPIWGAKGGMDNENLLLIQPTTGEDACDLVDSVVRARETSIVMVDSIAGLIPLKEIEASTEDSVMGKYAQLVSRFCRKLQQAILDERKRDHWVTVLLVNQWRMGMVQYGDPRVLPGGKATPYLASYHYDILAKEEVVTGKNSHSPTGLDIGGASHNLMTFKRMKNKLGNGLKEAETTFIRNPFHPLGERAYDEAEAVLGEAKKRGLCTGSGDDGRKPPYRLWNLDEKFKSLAEMVAYLYSDLDYYDALKHQVICHARGIMGMDTKNWRL